MKRARSSFDEMTHAFRELTESPGDGAATRARVLVGAGRSAARHAALRRVGPAIATILVGLSSVSAALTVAGGRWQAPAPVRIEANDGDSVGRSGAARVVRVIPFEAAATTSPPSPSSPPPLSGLEDAETIAYGRAHHAHFVDDAPARALAAWDAYLAAFPRGTFAPEAAYNRAICLVRLGRRAAAMRALRPLAAGRSPGYRREEARTLLDWLSGAAAGP